MYKRTLLLINDMSGTSNKIDTDMVKNALKLRSIDEVHLTNIEQDYNVKGYDEIIVYGGDGTICNAVNKCKNLPVRMYCFPCGTLNEKAKTSLKNESQTKKIKKLGACNGELFSYVLASGTFTEIGYVAKTKTKKKLKKLAYLLEVIKAYKVRNINAKIECEKGVFDGKFSLIMVLDSDRCFGFKFNRLYQDNDDFLYLLTIKSTFKDGIIGRIKIFFPFFRAFFVGFNKEFQSKNINFFKINSAKITLKNKYDFCIDGEKRTFDGVLYVNKVSLKPELYVMKNDLLNS